MPSRRRGVNRVQPRNCCKPREAFGDLYAEEREWQRPPAAKAHLLNDFRAAVVQHAMAVAVRRYKNERGWTQERLAREDGRPDAPNKWNARLRLWSQLLARADG